MKNLLFVISIVLFYISPIAAQLPETEVETKVLEATVFLENAQVFREKSVQLPAGESFVKFINLSPFIDNNSIQVKTSGSVSVLSVNHEQDFLNKGENDVELQNLIDSLQLINQEIQSEQTFREVVTEQIELLHANQDFGGNEKITVATLKEFNAYFRQELRTLKFELRDHDITIAELRKDLLDLQKEYKNYSEKNLFPTGEIIVKVRADQPATANFAFDYIVGNAGWYPSYDIRAANVSKPLQVVYKANVKQDTKVDWENVQLTFSSSNPNRSNIIPSLRTYFLNYNLQPPRYLTHLNSNEVSGVVYDQQGQAVIGATIRVQNTSIGSITDVDGTFSILIPNANSKLEISYIGMVPQIVPVSSNYMTIRLADDSSALQEVVVTGYSTKRKNDEITLRGAASTVPADRDESIPISIAQVQKATSFNFEFKDPYTVLSNNENYAVELNKINMSTEFEYITIPKIQQDVFLQANLRDWEKYNLLDGEANIFLDDTFMGKTLLSPQSASDSLQLSLGQDKRVTVTREKITDFSKRQFIGGKKTEQLAWRITVRNNTNEVANIVVLDQIPISQRDEIEVEVKEKSKASIDAETGTVKWQASISPNGSQVFDLIYTVKYPKNSNLPLE